MFFYSLFAVTYDIVVVVASAEIPHKHFQGEKWKYSQWCSDMDDFTIPELQRRYTLLFLPFSRVSSRSSEESRMWK